MHMPLCHAEVRPVEPAGAYADQHLSATRCGLGHIGDCGAVGAVDVSLHRIILACSGVGTDYSAASRRGPDIMPCRRLAMMDSASWTKRGINLAQLGMSWIKPCTWPADQMPWSASPVA